MKHITLIVGLPGSGKTHLAHEIIARYPNTTLLDDMSVDHDAKVEKGREAGDLVITDPTVCRVGPAVAICRLRDWFGEHDLDIIPFAIDVDACWENVSNRPDDRVISRNMIVSLARLYTPDEWGTPRPVWRPQ